EVEDADTARVGAALVGRRADVAEVVAAYARQATAARIGLGRRRRFRRAEVDRHLLEAGCRVGRGVVDVRRQVEQVVEIRLLDVREDDGLERRGAASRERCQVPRTGR